MLNDKRALAGTHPSILLKWKKLTRIRKRSLNLLCVKIKRLRTRKVSTHDMEEDPVMEAHEEVNEEPCQSQPQEEEGEEKLISPQKMTQITNIQTAADAKESTRRTDMEEARRIRSERLENEHKSSQEIFQEINRGWLAVKQKLIPQERQEALDSQQQLCAALIKDKKKLISDLRQELKVGDDRFVKDLRKQEEELDLMMERMENQIKTLTKAYRDELAQMSSLHQQESDVLLTKDKTEWGERMKKFWEEEMGRLAERRRNVEEYEALIHKIMLESNISFKNENDLKLQRLERSRQQIKARTMITQLKGIKPNHQIREHRTNQNRMRRRVCSLQKEVKSLRLESSTQVKQFDKNSKHLTQEYTRSIQQYENIRQKIKAAAVSDARQFEEMWLMMEEEVKLLRERVLVIDSEICEQHLGVPWERPPMGLVELSGPPQPQKPLLGSQRRTDLSVGPGPEVHTEGTDVGVDKGAGAVPQSESGAEVEEGKLSMETMKKVKELLCAEASFLMDDGLLGLLASLEKEEEFVVKLGSILSSFGIEEEDLPKLAEFILQYKHEPGEPAEVQRGRDEGVCAESAESSGKEEEVETRSTSHLTSELINPSHIVPALKSFLEQHMRSRESSARQSFHMVEARDSSADEAFWDSLGKTISDDKLNLWDAAGNTLKQYLEVLTEISELVPETQSLEQQNAELRMLLQQFLNSRVSTEPKTA
ncbi:dynein regulatory complex protein 1 isoform X2 [Pseudoliparis swirei]|uniref:dynein regulatory complex protein 1 isoform X2 n=1 Tax=Pseudoliparis swirei TaxID=2059687 RepID=UPI0024BDABCA|nr:dynein regulatory complex protein 1 isoform X2 [Pseudoliparis swirei]